MYYSFASHGMMALQGDSGYVEEFMFTYSETKQGFYSEIYFYIT